MMTAMEFHKSAKRNHSLIIAISLLLLAFQATVQHGTAELTGVVDFNYRIDRDQFYANYYGSIYAANDNTIYASWFETDIGVCNLLFAESLDGGETFNEPAVVKDCSDLGLIQLHGPSIAVYGEIIQLAWSQFKASSSLNQSIQLASSVNGGDSFIIKEIITDNISVIVPSTVLAYVGSRLYIAWSDDRSGTGYHAYLSYSNDHGETFSNPVVINSDLQNGTIQHPSVNLFSSSSGTLYMSWTDDFLGSGHWDLFLSWTDDGLSFSSRIKVSEYLGWMGELGELPNGDLVAVWKETIGQRGEVVYGVSTDKGATWSKSKVFTYGVECGSEIVQFDMEISNDGKMYVAIMASQYEDDNTGRSDLFLGLIEDPIDAIDLQGGTFLPTCIKVNTGDAKTNATSYRLLGQQPSLIVNTQGDSLVLYFIEVPDTSREYGHEIGTYVAKIKFNDHDTNYDDLFSLLYSLLPILIVFAIAILVMLYLLWRRRRNHQEK